MWFLFPLCIILFGILFGILLLKLCQILWRIVGATSPVVFGGSHVCITGGSEGIGLGIAAECIKRNASTITLMARTADKLSIAKQLLENEFAAATDTTKSIQKSITINTVRVDVSDAAQVERAFSEAAQLSGPIDILFVCAGICTCDNFENLSSNEVKSVLDTNLLGAMLSAKQVLPNMKQQQKGCICFMLSQAAQIGMYGFTAYSASKFGLIGFIQALTMEMTNYNITISAAYPADVDTPGYVKENERKPQMTKTISGTNGLWNPKDVAQMTVNAIERGDTRITYGFLGRLLDIATCGFNTPTTSIWRSSFELILSGPLRLVVTILCLEWYRATNAGEHQPTSTTEEVSESRKSR